MPSVFKHQEPKKKQTSKSKLTRITSGMSFDYCILLVYIQLVTKELHVFNFALTYGNLDSTKNSTHLRGRVASSSPDSARAAPSNGMVTPFTKQKLNNYLSTKQLRLMDEIKNSKSKYSTYLTKLKPKVYLPQVHTHRNS